MSEHVLPELGNGVEQASEAVQATAVVVSGMHRSGTSALTRVISLLGARLPDDPIPGREGDNDAGFWESQRVVDLNQELLRESGSWWCGWQQIELDDAQFADAVNRARAVIRDEFGSTELLVLKDPRVSRLMPVWRRALNEEGYRCVHVLALRDPAQVAGSLSRRNELAPSVSGLSWLAHVLDAERSTREESRVVVGFDELLENWRAQADRIAAALGLTWPRSYDEVADTVDEFLDPALQRAEAISLELLGPVYDVLHDWSLDREGGRGRALLDDWYDRFAPVRRHPSAVSAMPANRHEVNQTLATKGQIRASRDNNLAWLRIVNGAYGAEAAIAWAWLEEEWRLVRRVRRNGREIARLRRRVQALGQDRPRRSLVRGLRRRGARALHRLGLRQQSTTAGVPSARPSTGLPDATTLPDLAAAVAAPPTPVSAAQSVRPTNLGPVIDAAVAQGRAQQLPAGADPDYDLVRANFDLAGYLLQAPTLLNEPHADPVARYLRRGKGVKSSPHVNFSMQEYLKRNPHRANANEHPYLAWLKRGRAAGEIADPAPGMERLAPTLGMEAAELAGVLADARNDLQERLRHGTLGRMWTRAAEIEPMVAASWTESIRPKLAPLSSPNAIEQMVAMQRCQSEAQFRRARLVLVINRPRWGGGRRVEGHISHTLNGLLEPADIVVIHTEHSGQSPVGRYPDGVREIDLAAATSGMPKPAAQRVLVELIRSLRADAVVNINSALFYDALISHGKALAATERVFLMFFCTDQAALGHWTGYPLRYFYRLFDVVTGVITDSHYLAGWLRDTYQVPEEAMQRVHVFSAPVDPSIPMVAARSAAARPQVFWAGRWDRQKRVDIVMQIAARMPDVDFRMWGEAWTDGSEMVAVPDNVRLEGRYDQLTDIPLEEASAWLYTSAWDGVPSQLLEVSMTGVPLVGSDVGGTGEVLLDGHAWAVSDFADPDAYVTALREVLDDPEKGRRRARALREALLEERTEDAYRSLVAGLLLTGSSRGDL